MKIANDTPQYILAMIDAVDYNRITDEQYKNWQTIISENIGKHLKKRTKPAVLIAMNYPIKQELCDLINEYDFKSLPVVKQAIATSAAKLWANANLPLKQKL